MVHLGLLIVLSSRNGLLYQLRTLLHTVETFNVPTPNVQPFLPFLIFPLYFCPDLSFITFLYILLRCSSSDVAIFEDIMKFEFN